MKKRTRKIRRRVIRQKAAKRPSRRARQHAKHASRKIKRYKKLRPRKHRKIARRKIRRHAKHRTRRHKASRPKVFIGKGILEQLFESQAKVKLMKFFFRSLEESFPLRDILKMLRVNPSTVRKEMKKLIKIGIIKKTKKQGRIVYYLNQGFDFLKELKDLILKSTISSKEELKENARKTGNIKLLVLAGIFRGQDGAGADLLVVGDKINQRKFSTFLKDLEAEVGKELNCALMSAKEFNYRYDMYDRFVRDLISENSDVLINKLNLW